MTRMKDVRANRQERIERNAHAPMICKGVIVLPKISTDPVIRRISLKTPASVRTRPLPAPTRNTAATLSRNATKALLRRIRGLWDVKRWEYMRHTEGRDNIPNSHDFVEWCQTLRQRQDGKVDERAHRRVVMERDKRVHLETVKQDLNHHQSRRFKLHARRGSGGKDGWTQPSRPRHNQVIRYIVLTATAAACVKNPTRLNRSSPLDARATPDEIMNTITASFLLGSWIRKVHEIRRMATGVNALSIWMYATLRYRYAVLLRIRDALNRRPIGRIDRRNMSLVTWTSFAPSTRWVVRWRTRVPIAYETSVCKF